MLGEFKDWVEIVEGIVTTAAILAGAVWAYLQFGWRRELRHRAAIEHNVQFRRLGQTMTLVRVGVKIQNLGTVLMKFTGGFVRLQAVAPCTDAELEARANCINLDDRDDSEADWRILKQRTIRGISEIEPSESDTAYVDFIIDEPIECIIVYSHIGNAAKRTDGWNHTTLHEVELKGV